MVNQEKTPQTFGITQALKRIDYADTFSVTNHKNTLEEITILVLGEAPNWVKQLFRLRNYLVKLVGIKSIDKTEVLIDYRENGNIAFFKILNIYDNEVILGTDDDHLNFRVSIFDAKTETQNIKVTTIVEFHNRKGKLYFGLIKPFHKMIVKAMTKNAMCM